MRTGYEENGISIHTILLFELSIFFCCIKLLYIIYMYCFIFFFYQTSCQNKYISLDFLVSQHYISNFQKGLVFLLLQKMFSKQAAHLCCCVIYMYILLFKGKTNQLNFTPFRKFLSATVGVRDNHKIFAAIVW